MIYLHLLQYLNKSAILPTALLSHLHWEIKLVFTHSLHVHVHSYLNLNLSVKLTWNFDLPIWPSISVTMEFCYPVYLTLIQTLNKKIKIPNLMIKKNQFFTDRQSGKFAPGETFRLLKWEQAESCFRQSAASCHPCWRDKLPPDWKQHWKSCRVREGTWQGLGGKERSCRCWGKTKRKFWQSFSLHIRCNELGVKLKGQIMYFERVLSEGTYALPYFKWCVLKTLASFYAHVASFSS